MPADALLAESSAVAVVRGAGASRITRSRLSKASFSPSDAEARGGVFPSSVTDARYLLGPHGHLHRG